MQILCRNVYYLHIIPTLWYVCSRWNYNWSLRVEKYNKIPLKTYCYYYYYIGMSSPSSNYKLFYRCHTIPRNQSWQCARARELERSLNFVPETYNNWLVTNIELIIIYFRPFARRRRRRLHGANLNLKIFTAPSNINYNDYNL